MHRNARGAPCVVKRKALHRRTPSLNLLSNLKRWFLCGSCTTSGPVACLAAVIVVTGIRCGLKRTPRRSGKRATPDAGRAVDWFVNRSR